MSQQSRRDFIKTGLLSTLFLGSGLSTKNHFQNVQDAGKAKNIIVLVSDGMSAGTLAMADIFQKRQAGKSTNWIRLYEEGKVHRGLMDMASANKIVTDSSAASSSWGCGHRINNGAVNVGPDGTHYKPILPVFRDAGKQTGLVTTAEITHATPAGFAANVESRNMGETIAEQYLERKIDVLLGGGNRHFSSEQRSDGTDLYRNFSNEGYKVAKNREQFLQFQNSDDRLLGVFSEGHMPYSLDHRNIPKINNAVPTLSEMTETALQKLTKSDNGFILQVEGARVDHAAHGNDVGGLIYDQIAFDEALGVALAYAENRDDTLVIITTDHGNANPAFNSAPNENFDKIAEFTYTNDWIHSGLNEESSVSQIRERVEAATQIVITRQEAEAYQQSVKGTYSTIYSEMTSPSSVLGQIIANHTDLNWTGHSHTANYSELASFGPGSEALKGFVRNTDLFNVMVEAAGVRDYV